MRITDVTTNEFIEAVTSRPDTGHEPRSSGVHVSDIIRDIENSLIHKGQRRKYDELSAAERTRMGAYVSVGWAWEDILSHALKAVLKRRGLIHPMEQLTQDGITGTPDGWDDMIEEYKATWRSSSRPIDPDFWHWLVQIKAYCYMAETMFARLRIWYVNGDYRDSGPQVKTLQLKFGEAELQENWDMLRQHAQEKGWLKRENGKRKGSSGSKER
jgi:hypothetical protein